MKTPLGEKLEREGRARTWPYGTRKSVRVEVLVLGRAAVTIEEATGEAFVLLGVELAGVKPEQRREIRFCEGGPTGGFWEFVR